MNLIGTMDTILMIIIKVSNVIIHFLLVLKTYINKYTSNEIKLSNNM